MSKPAPCTCGKGFDPACQFSGHHGQWRDEPSVVTAVKAAYRGASRRQREMLRAWMRRVLSGQDGNR